MRVGVLEAESGLQLHLRNPLRIESIRADDVLPVIESGRARWINLVNRSRGVEVGSREVVLSAAPG